jgi:hypothetical protein
LLLPKSYGKVKNPQIKPEQTWAGASGPQIHSWMGRFMERLIPLFKRAGSVFCFSQRLRRFCWVMAALAVLISCTTSGGSASPGVGYPASDAPAATSPALAAGTPAEAGPSAGTKTGPEPAGSAGAAPLDSAIAELAAYFAEQLPQGRKIAVTGIEAETRKLTEYIVQELEAGLGKSGKFTIIDRQNLAILEDELILQADGLVSDASAQRIGQMFGPQTIVFGKLTPLANSWRLALYASDVESGVSRTQTRTIPPDPRFKVNENDSAELVEQAVFELSKGLNQRTSVAIGRICRDETGTVTNLSEYLKRSISREALRLKNKFTVKGEGENAGADAVIEGIFTPWGGGGAEISLQLYATTPDKTPLGAGVVRFSRQVMLDGDWSLLPPNTTGDNYEEKLRLLRTYDGRDNPFVLTIRGDHEDGIYYDGDYLNLFIYAEQDCYFKVTYINAENEIMVFYPRNNRDRNFIRAGETRRIPDVGSFRLHKPFGEEYILVAAYEDPFEINPGRTAAFSATAVANSLVVRGGSFIDPVSGNIEFNTNMTPDVTTKYSFSVLEKK